MNQALGPGQPSQGLAPGPSSLPPSSYNCKEVLEVWLSKLFPSNWILFNASMPVFTMNGEKILHRLGHSVEIQFHAALQRVTQMRPLQRCLTELRRNKSHRLWPHSTLGRLHPHRHGAVGDPSFLRPCNPEFSHSLDSVSPPVEQKEMAPILTHYYR